jgi:uncharacterized membrane protein YcaP (DUF421 family)
LVRVVIVGLLAYVALVTLLRISGKRTLSKLNAFDLVVTVALGSTLATILLNKDVALAEGVVAFATLIMLQFVITWSSVRVPFIDRLVKAQPTRIVEDGKIQERSARDVRLTRSEIEAAVRQQGLASFDQVGIVVLETDGSISVVPLTAMSTSDVNDEKASVISSTQRRE